MITYLQNTRTCRKMHPFVNLFILLVGIGFIKGNQEYPNTIGMVINKDSLIMEDFVHIQEQPAVITGTSSVIIIEYRCTDDGFIGVEVISNVNSKVSQKIFQKIWRCHKSDTSQVTKLKKVRLKLPPEIAFNYNAYNKLMKYTARSKVRAWVLEKVWWPSCFRQSNCYTRSSVKVAYNVHILPPFSRPYFSVYKQCRSWGWKLIAIATSYKIPTCPYEQEIIEAIVYPVVLGGDTYGIYRQFPPYMNPDLESKRHEQLNNPRFTLSMWLYVLDYCVGTPRPGKLCSIMHHFTWNGEYRTILVLLTPDGRIHIQIQEIEGRQIAGLTDFSIPRHQWVRMVLQFKTQSWKVVINYGETFTDTLETEYKHPGGRILYDDAMDLFTFGGSEYMPSFKGYIGQATIYRNKVLEPRKIPMPSQFHPMFELKLTRHEEKCNNYLEWVNCRIKLHQYRYTRSLQKFSCHQPFLIMIQSAQRSNSDVSSSDTCPTNGRRYSRYRKQIDRVVKQIVWNGTKMDLRHIADRLYQNATSLLAESLATMPEAFPLLKQSACFGNTDAMYTVSVILNNGIYVRANEIQSQAYLMLAALDNHRLAALALGHKHRYGIDGVTEDWEQTYRYHKFVADTTNADKEAHKDTDVYTESIRLTDEAAIREQTDEEGDIFHWLTHQAKQGVLSAQNRVGRALFWGQQGLKRNLASAVEYFKLSADTGDSQSQYDYGIVLMRGQGVQKDTTAGLKQLHSAAKQSNPSAINAIGWYAMSVEENMARAADFYEKAHNMGNPDASYNLGVMYLHGTYPGKEKDADKALEYFRRAGVRGQMDAGVAIAYQTMKGTSKQPRDVYTAVEWARFIAEKNPAIGIVLRKALQAYRTGKRDVSLFYYALVADAGVEVGSFNNAWLCEENKNGITSFIEKECVWRRYNMSTQREKQFVDSYALLKMGDYYWYGCEGRRDVKRAANYYAEAARKHDPQALFNLGFMMEDGVDVSESILDDIRVPQTYRSNNMTLLKYLYSRCKDSHMSDAYIPCTIALWRIQVIELWARYQTIIKLTGFIVISAMTALSTYIYLLSHPRVQPQMADNI